MATQPPVRRPAVQSSGIRVVDAPPPRRPPVSRTAQVPNALDFDDDSDDVSPLNLPKITKFSKPDEDDDLDESLWEIANTHRARSRFDASSAESSSRQKQLKTAGAQFKRRPPLKKPPTPVNVPARTPVRRRPPIPPPSQRNLPLPESDSDDIDSISSDDYSDDDTPPGIGGGGGLHYDPLEEETMKAVRKAKLLARVEQLKEKNITPSKNFTYKSAEDELMVEVARMEVLHERSIRIEQGRSALMTTIGVMEAGCNAVDNAKWIPFPLNQKGLNNHIHANLDKFDDCLERGVAETIGPGSSRVWWIELISILVPTMIMYGMNNRPSQDPKYMGQLLKDNPAFQAELAKEVAREMSYSQRQDKEQLEQEVKALRKELDSGRDGHTPFSTARMPVPREMPAMGGVAPPKMDSIPLPRSMVPNKNPLGDYKPDAQQTQEMAAFIAQQEQQKRTTQALQQTLRSEVQQQVEAATKAAGASAVPKPATKAPAPIVRKPAARRQLPPRPSARPGSLRLEGTESDES